MREQPQVAPVGPERGVHRARGPAAHPHRGCVEAEVARPREGPEPVQHRRDVAPRSRVARERAVDDGVVHEVDDRLAVPGHKPRGAVLHEDGSPAAVGRVERDARAGLAGECHAHDVVFVALHPEEVSRTLGQPEGPGVRRVDFPRGAEHCEREGVGGAVERGDDVLCRAGEEAVFRPARGRERNAEVPDQGLMRGVEPAEPDRLIGAWQRAAAVVGDHGRT